MRTSSHSAFIAACCLLAALAGCSGGSGNNDSSGTPPDEVADPAPAVSAMRPAKFVAGDKVELTGSNFDNATLAVNGAAIEITAQSAHQLEFIAPDLPPGTYMLEIQRGEAQYTGEAVYQPLLATAISAGGFHNCALTAAGSVSCWGENEYGQLGNGEQGDSQLPVAVVGLDNAVEVSAGYAHSCALTSEATVYCWGRARGEAQPVTPSPVLVSGLGDPVMVSAGSDYSCAVLADGTVRCWGNNSDGQLGDGSTADSPTPVTVSGLSDVVAVSTGERHACALTAAGSVSCWGSNYAGQLGDGTENDSPTPVTVQGLNDVVEIGAGRYFSCALDSAGQAWCWGLFPTGTVSPSDDFRYLDFFFNFPLPQAISGVSGASELSVGTAHSCVLGVDGLAQCWGENYTGELGVNAYKALIKETDSPQSVDGLGEVIAVAAGRAHSCALEAAGTVRCWGLGLQGQLTGIPHSDWTPPFIVEGIEDATAISVAENYRCALVEDGSVMCWGDDSLGQLGNDVGGSPVVPTPVSGLGDVTALSLNGGQSCALTAADEVYCWGLSNLFFGLISASFGGPSPGPESIKYVPTLVPSLPNTNAISAGDYTNYAISEDGSVKVWKFILLDPWAFEVNVNTAYSSTAVEFPLLADAVSIANNNPLAPCALIADGSVQCWAANPADGTANTPVTIDGLSNVEAITNGTGFTCVLSAGRVYCWGSNDAGQLGDGTFDDSETPVEVAGLDNIASISAGTRNICALTGGGAAYCWGEGYGPLEDGAPTNGPSPVLLPGLVDVAEISSDSLQTCARYADGAVTCWGGPLYEFAPEKYDVPQGEQREVVTLP